MKCVCCSKDAEIGRKKCSEHLLADKKRKLDCYYRNKNDGKCFCGKPAEQGKVRCKCCLQRESVRRENRRRQSLCVICGDKTVNGRCWCKKCAVEQNEKKRKTFLSRKSAGVCTQCGVMPLFDKSLCVECREKKAIRKEDRKKAGLCIICGSKASCSYCEVCILKDRSQKLWGCSNRWNELRELFNRQNGICPYTGRRLIIGIDASIDHIIPVSKKGTSDLGNLQWVHEIINKIKYNHNHEDFLQVISEVYEHCIKERR